MPIARYPPTSPTFQDDFIDNNALGNVSVSVESVVGLSGNPPYPILIVVLLVATASKREAQCKGHRGVHVRTCIDLIVVLLVATASKHEAQCKGHRGVHRTTTVISTAVLL